MKKRILCIILTPLLLFFYTKLPCKSIEFGVYIISDRDSKYENQNAFLDRVIDDFEKSYNINVHYYSGIREEDYSEWLWQQILKGKTPDVFMILENDFSKLVSLGVAENLNTFINNDNLNIEKYYKSVYEKGKGKDANLYALPFEVEPKLMIVNKTLLKNNNINIPNQDWTWDEFYEISERITKDVDGDGVLDYFGNFNYSWEDAMYSNSYTIKKMEDMYSMFLTDEVISSVVFYKRLNKLNGGYKVTQDNFDSGNVAFMPLYFSEYKTYKTYPYKVKKYDKFEWDCITMPKGSQGDNSSTVKTILMGISNSSKNKMIAYEFLKYLTFDEDVQTALYTESFGSSALKTVVSSDYADQILEGLNSDIEPVINSELLNIVMEKSTAAPNFPQYSEIISYANGYIVNIDDNIQRELYIMQESINNILDNNID
ncbi:MAG: ABC transporter substrate-binding protein [Lachnospirales bacterium]